MSARNERYSQLGLGIRMIFLAFFKVGTVFAGALARLAWVVMNKKQ